MRCDICGRPGIDLTVPWPDERCRVVCDDVVCLEVAEERRIEWEGRNQLDREGGNDGRQ